MFTTKSQNLVLIILVVAATLAVIVAVFLVKKPEVGTVLAQGGDVNNYDVPSDLGVPPFEAGVVSPQSDGSGIEAVPIGAFRNDGNNANGWRHYFPGGYIRNNSYAGVCFMAPTYPPEGATLTAFSISIKDQSATYDLSFVRLHRVNLATGVVDIMAWAPVSYNDPSPVELFAGIASGTEVVSKDYAYYVNLCFPSNTFQDILFYGATLFYTPPTLPL